MGLGSQQTGQGWPSSAGLHMGPVQRSKLRVRSISPCRLSPNLSGQQDSQRVRRGPEVSNQGQNTVMRQKLNLDLSKPHQLPVFRKHRGHKSR